MDKEICICAAVLTTDGTVIRGHRHHDCIAAIRHRNKEMRHDPDAQGFVTSKGGYVTRQEGRKLQDAAGIKSADPTGYGGDDLYSEDLY